MTMAADPLEAGRRAHDPAAQATCSDCTEALRLKRFARGFQRDERSGRFGIVTIPVPPVTGML